MELRFRLISLMFMLPEQNRNKRFYLFSDNFYYIINLYRKKDVRNHGR